MRKTTAWALIGIAGGGLSPQAVTLAFAQGTSILHENPTDCEIAAALGLDKPGCPPLTQIPVPIRPSATRDSTVDTASPTPLAITTPPPHPATVAVAKPAPTPPPPPPALASTPAPATQPAPAVLPVYTANFEIKFELASARLTDDAHQILDQIGAAMTSPSAKDIRFRIIGHTDALGSATRNQKLSEARANAVRSYLLQHFAITPTRLEASGQGARAPLDPRDPNAIANRRVEITNLGH